MTLTVSDAGELDVGFEAHASNVTDAEISQALSHVLQQALANPNRVHPTVAQQREQARHERIATLHPATHMVAVDGVARWLCAECAGADAIKLPPGSAAACAAHLEEPDEPEPAHEPEGDEIGEGAVVLTQEDLQAAMAKLPAGPAVVGAAPPKPARKRRSR